MDDMYKSIKAFLYDRTSSPLFGAFIISWSIINYRVILTIFSGESLANKFEVINTLFQPIDTGFFLVSGSLVHGFIYPVIATLSYIYLYPRLAKPVYKHSLKKQIELREIKQEEESNRLLTLEESRDIYREMAEVEEKFNLQQEKHRAQVSSLLNENKELEKGREVTPTPTYPLSASYIQERIDRLKKDKFTLSDVVDEKDWVKFTDVEKRDLGKKFKEYVEGGRYSNINFYGVSSSNQAQYAKVPSDVQGVKTLGKMSGLKEEILSLFAAVPNHPEFSSDEVYNSIGGHPIQLQLALEELLENGYIEVISKFEEGKFFRLAKKGRRYVVDNKMLGK